MANLDSLGDPSKCAATCSNFDALHRGGEIGSCQVEAIFRLGADRLTSSAAMAWEAPAKNVIRLELPSDMA